MNFSVINITLLCTFFHKHRISIFRYINVAFDFQIMDLVFKLNLVYILPLHAFCIIFIFIIQMWNWIKDMELKWVMVHKATQRCIWIKSIAQGNVVIINWILGNLFYGKKNKWKKFKYSFYFFLYRCSFIKDLNILR